jgi:hypothetical protein
MNIDGHDIDDATLMAYVDGELPAAEAARVETAIAADPELAATVARHRALRARIAGAYAPLADEPVPDRLRAMLTAPSADVVDLRTRATAVTASARRWSTREWIAMAACLLLGVALARLLPPSPPAVIDDAMLAQGTLARGLDDVLAGKSDADAPVVVNLSFRARSGEICRAFALRAPQPLAGLACREGGDWRVDTLTAMRVAPAGGLRTASSALPPAVLAEIDARIDGEPLDPAGERAARAADWR